jgi:hypothetical protein
MVLGFNALKTGMKILPLSLAIIIFSVIGTRLTTRFAVRRIVRIGQLFLVIGAGITMAAINADLQPILFGIGMFGIGSGLGLLASQIGNVNLSAGTEDDSSEIGGLQGTSQNLGSSLGTALIGSVLIFSLTAGFTSAVASSQTLPADVKTYIASKSSTGVQIVSASQVEDYAVSQGLPADQASEIAHSYQTAQLAGLEESMFFVMVLALLSIALSKNIPNVAPKPAQGVTA